MKKPAPIFRAEVKAGKLLLPARKSFSDHLRTLEGPVEVIVRRAREKRSLDANRYYWGVVLTVFADSTGYDPEELHVVLKERFLTVQGDSTAELDSEQFAHYIDQVIRLAAEMGCIVPEPNTIEV